MMKVMMVLLTLITTISVVNAAYVYSTDADGNWKDLFDGDDNIYAIGSGFQAEETCRIYIMKNGNWETKDVGGIPPGSTGTYDVYIGDTIPMDKKVVGPIEIVTTNGGNLLNTLVWSPPLQTGKFDIIVDCKNVGGDYGSWDGAYDPTSRDAVDTNFCIGFTVVPESVLAVGLIALLVPGLIYVARKKSA